MLTTLTKSALSHPSHPIVPAVQLNFLLSALLCSPHDVAPCIAVTVKIKILT